MILKKQYAIYPINLQSKVKGLTNYLFPARLQCAGQSCLPSAPAAVAAFSAAPARGPHTATATCLSRTASVRPPRPFRPSATFSLWPSTHCSSGELSSDPSSASWESAETRAQRQHPQQQPRTSANNNSSSNNRTTETEMAIGDGPTTRQKILVLILLFSFYNDSAKKLDHFLILSGLAFRRCRLKNCRYWSQVASIWIFSAIFALATCFPDKIFGVSLEEISAPPPRDIFFRSTMISNNSQPFVAQQPTKELDLSYCYVKSNVNMMDYVALGVAFLLPLLLGPCIVAVFQVLDSFFKQTK